MLFIPGTGKEHADQVVYVWRLRPRWFRRTDDGKTALQGSDAPSRFPRDDKRLFFWIPAAFECRRERLTRRPGQDYLISECGASWWNGDDDVMAPLDRNRCRPGVLALIQNHEWRSCNTERS
jgi:hypothetical protein